MIQNILSNTKTEEINTSELISLIKEILAQNPQIKIDFNKGKENVVQFVVGQVMYKLRKKIDTNILKELIIEEIK